MRPAVGQVGTARPDVAGEDRLLPDQRLDGESHVERGGDDFGRLQRPRVGARDDLGYRLLAQMPDGGGRLRAAGVRQARVAQAGVLAVPAEMQVEMRLPVAHQDHRRPRSPPPCRNML